MKRILSVATVLYVLFVGTFFPCGSFSNEPCVAAGNPYIIIAKEVWLLDSETGRRLFLLPETYFAAITGMDESYYTVCFNGVTGKVARSLVQTTGYHAEANGTAKTMHVSPKYASFSALRMRSSPELAEDENCPQIPVSEPFTYLGSYPISDETWYYVGYGEARGYVLSSLCDTPSVVIEPFIPEKEKTDEPTGNIPQTTEPTSQPIQEADKSDVVKIIVIGGVGVVLIVILIVLFIPKKGKHRNRYYYENE